MHWVIAELDVHGEIDAHAALCLHHAIAGARANAIDMVLVDLRDLTAITPAGATLFGAQRADCRTRGIELGLLISGRQRNAPVAQALVRAGLGDTLHYTCEPSSPRAGHAVTPLRPAIEDPLQDRRPSRYERRARAGGTSGAGPRQPRPK